MYAVYHILADSVERYIGTFNAADLRFVLNHSANIGRHFYVETVRNKPNAHNI